MLDIPEDYLPSDYMELYNQFFALAVRSCSDHTGVAVASTMIGIAMRLYRTSLTDDDFDKIISHVLMTCSEVQPYTTLDFAGSGTLH
jgi:hypothetical protein